MSLSRGDGYVGGRFLLELGGRSAGWIKKVSAIENSGTARLLAAHELAHVVQQGGKSHKRLRLDGGRLKLAELARWIGPQSAVLVQLDPSGRTVARYALGRLKPGRIVKTPSNVANEVAIESLELVHEGVTLD